MTGGTPVPMSIIARLNLDAQAISVSQAYKDAGVGLDSSPLKAIFAERKAAGQEVNVAMDVPGRHARHVDALLAGGRRHRPNQRSLASSPFPAADGRQYEGRHHGRVLRRRAWNEQLVNQGIGFTAATTGEIWKNHPEKALSLRNDFIEANPMATQAILMAVMEAAQWADATENKEELATSWQAQLVQYSGRRRGRAPQGRYQLWQWPRRCRDRARNEVLEGPRVLPVQEPRCPGS